MDWIWIIVALLAGLAAGGASAYAVMKRRYGDRDSVAEVRSEYQKYRREVTEHFVETADLINTLTRSYKRVYDHLETGAYDLVGEDTLRRELDAPEDGPVTIEYLGQRRQGAAALDERPTARPARPVPRTPPTTPATPAAPADPARSPDAPTTDRAEGDSRPSADGREASEAEERTRSAG